MKEKYTAGEWTLWWLEGTDAGEERWSLGKLGPRMYLTCNEHTAIMVLEAVANYSMQLSGKAK